MQGPIRIAQTLGSNKLFKINHLRDCESPVTGVTGRRATIDAVVEFSARAVAGFAGG
jgi:hypothetical protein